ncbi:MAG: PH domain-containing protein [Thermoplasmata archaeon]
MADPEAASPPLSPARLDAEGTFRVRGEFSYAVIGTYVALALIVMLILLPRESAGYTWVPYLLTGILAFLLARYLSVRYTLDDTNLRASRLLGGRRIPLEEIRGIEFSALRDLTPTSSMAALGPVGWHGRMWSPQIGTFDSVFTDAAHGLLLTTAENPIFISPRDPVGFARELSRRVRSYTGPLEHDVGHPGSG